MPTYTTDALISGVKEKILFPTSQITFQTSDLVTLLSKELQGRLMPFYLKEREDFFIVNIDYTWNVDPDARQYAIPARAVGQKVNEVCFEQPDQKTFIKMVRINADDINNYGFFFKDNKLNVYKNQTQGYLRIYYYRRPAYIAAVTDCAQVTNIAGNVITCSTVPTTWTTSTILDVVGAQIPFSPLADDQLPTAITTGTNGTITFTAPITGLAIGDWIAPQYSAPLAQMPVEAWNLLELYTSARIALTFNYTSQLENLNADIARMEADIRTMVTPRSDRNPMKISNRPYNTFNYPFSRRFTRM